MPTPLLFSDVIGSNVAAHRIDDIAGAYPGPSQGKAGTALRRAIDDALFDLLEAKERARESRRPVLDGSARGGVQAL